MAWTVIAMILTMGVAIEFGTAKAPQLQLKSMAKASLPRFKSIVDAPQPQFRQIRGSPVPTDFGCTTTFDAVDLCSMDNKYYYFMGSYLYTIEKFSSTITGPSTVADFFSGLTLPVHAAFSTGPLKPLMFIIDSSNSTNVKVYKFNTASAYPRSPLMTTSVEAVFSSSRSSLTQSVSAVLSITSPARVYVFGNSSTTTAASFKYNTGAPVGSMFTYVGEVQTGWNATVTGASMWYNMSTGVTKNFLYNNSGMVALVSTTLAIEPPGNATALSSCPSWVPPQMNGCCTSQSNANATPQVSTTSVSTTVSTSSPVSGSSASEASSSTASGPSTAVSTGSLVTDSSASAASNSTASGASTPASTSSPVTGSSASAASDSTANAASTPTASSASVSGANTAAGIDSTSASPSSTGNGQSTAAASNSAVTNASTLASSGSTAIGASTPPAT